MTQTHNTQPPNGTQSASDLSDDALLAVMEQQWQEAMDSNPELQDYIDAADAFVCPRAELLDAIRMSIDTHAYGVSMALYQVFQFRLTMSQISGFNF